jgi:hypothetical protein
VHVTSYSPFRGLRGTVLKVNSIADDFEEPFCFYLVALEGAHIHEPIWFEYHEIEAMLATDEGMSLKKSSLVT